VTTSQKNKATLLLPFISILLFLAAQPCFATAQNEDSSKCSALYENHNQIDYGPLKVRIVQGSSNIGTSSQDESVAFGACFALFTEKERKLVTIISGGSDGHFKIDDVKPGRYRLVARVEGFCAANIPLVVTGSAPRKARILVHFRTSGIDTCSYAEISH
jgi:hypothetical protein